MVSKIREKAAGFLHKRKYDRWRMSAFLCMAVVVVLGTVAMLRMTGKALTHTEKVLDCPYAAQADTVIHTHNDDCYDQDGTLVCSLPERESHHHTDECYEEEKVLVCEEEESQEAAGHEHTEECYTREKGELICEKEEHTHGDGCYEKTLICEQEEHTHGDGCTEKVLVCESEEEDHEHDDSCYEEQNVCEKEEHEHGDDCYEQTLICETEEHTHTDDCYAWEDTLTCTAEEAEETKGHIHTDDCYEIKKVLTCGKLEAHTHDDSCYDEDGNLICGKEEAVEHTHDKDCFQTVEVTDEEEKKTYYCGKEEHTHSDSCYAEDGSLICELEEHTHTDACLNAEQEEETTYYCGKEEHTHSDSCYAEDGSLICELEEHTHTDACLNAEQTDKTYYCGKEEHTHGADCYDADGNLICKLDEHTHDENCLKEQTYYCGKEEHTHSSDCYDADGNLTCKLEEHTHNAICLLEDPVFYCGKEEHTHGAACYDADGNLICELEEHIHNESCLEEPVYYCGKEEHTHEDGCYDENGRLICEKEAHTHNAVCLLEAPFFYCGKEAHVHTAGCYGEDGELICEIEEHIHDENCLEEPIYYCGKEEHIHTDDCYAENGRLICEKEAHTHNEVCLVEAPFFYCGKEAHVHTAKCYDQDGNLICELEEHIHDENCLVPDITLTAEGEDYVITMMASAAAFADVDVEKLSLNVEKLTEDTEKYQTTKELVEEIMKPDTNSMETEDEKEGEKTGSPFEITIEGEDDIEAVSETDENMEGEDEKEEPHHIFDITVQEDGTEIQPAIPVQVTFTLKEENSATLDEEVLATNHMYQVYHVDAEENMVEDMNALMDEEGNTVIDTPHFSTYDVTIVNSQSSESSSQIFTWNALAEWIAAPEQAKKKITIKLPNEGDIIADCQMEIIGGRDVTINLSGCKIICSGAAAPFKVESAKLTITDTNNLVDTIINNESLGEAWKNWTENRFGWEVSRKESECSYDGDGNLQCTYYLTKSDMGSAGTSETTEKHSVNFANVGMIENKTQNISELIYVGKNGTLSVEGGCLSNAQGRAITVKTNSSERAILNLNKGYFVGNGSQSAPVQGGAIYFQSSGMLNIGNGFVIAANRSQYYGGGVAVCGNEKEKTVVTMDGGIVSSNETTEKGVTGDGLEYKEGNVGGGIYIQKSVLEIKDGFITNNYVKGNTNDGGLNSQNGGGGVCIYDADMIMSGGIIAANEVERGGGGIYIRGGNLFLQEGIVASNRARAEGGGIRIGGEDGLGYCVVAPTGGMYITNNVTLSRTVINSVEEEDARDWGGGGVFIKTATGKMLIAKSLVTDNESIGFGGGVSGCATGEISINLNDGAGIYGNHARGLEEGLSSGEHGKTEDSLAYIEAGKGGPFANGYQDVFAVHKCSVDKKMLGGGFAGWQGSCNGKKIDRSESNFEGKITIQDNEGKDGPRLGLTANPDEDAVKEAIKNAKVFISGNKSATHGGGIMCNGELVMGEATITREEEIVNECEFTVQFRKSYRYVASKTLDYTIPWNGKKGSFEVPELKDEIPLNKDEFVFDIYELQSPNIPEYTTSYNNQDINYIYEHLNDLKASAISLPSVGVTSGICQNDEFNVNFSFKYNMEDGRVPKGVHYYYLEEKKGDMTDQDKIKYDDSWYVIKVVIDGEDLKEVIQNNVVRKTASIQINMDQIKVLTELYKYGGSGLRILQENDIKKTKMENSVQLAIQPTYPVTKYLLGNMDDVGEIYLKTDNEGNMSAEPYHATGFIPDKTAGAAFTNTYTEDKAYFIFKIHKTAVDDFSRPAVGAEFSLQEIDKDGNTVGKAVPAITDSTGELLYKGVVGKRYILTELEVAPGYDSSVPMPGPWIVEASEEKYGGESVYKECYKAKISEKQAPSNSLKECTGEHISSHESNVLQYFHIENTPLSGGYELPETGGLGKERYEIAGALLTLMTLMSSAFCLKKKRCKRG